MQEFFNVEYVPTGMIYNLPKSDIDQFISDEPENFKIIDKSYKKPVVEPTEPTVYEKVVGKKK